PAPPCAGPGSTALPKSRAGPAAGTLHGLRRGCRQSPQRPAGQRSHASPAPAATATFLMPVILPPAAHRLDPQEAKSSSKRRAAGPGERLAAGDGAGVIVGSNVFNLAALLGLAAVVAGWIAFHRRVVLLAGVPAVWVAAITLLTVTVLGPVAGLALTAAVMVPYVAVLGMRRARMERLRLPARWTAWLGAAIPGEEDELAEAVRPARGTWRDGFGAAGALVAVVGASTVMEVAATAAGHRYRVADIVTGGLVLAIVTSLPNAVAAVYLARRGRVAALLIAVT